MNKKNPFRLLSPYLGVPGLVLLVSGAICTVRFIGTQYSAVGLIQLVCGALFCGLYLVTCLGEFVSSVARSKSVILGTLGAALVLGILVMINVIANTKLEYRKDLTENKVWSLAPDSVNVIKGLKDEIELVGFFPDGTPEKKAFQDLADQYRVGSGQIKVSITDPDKSPELAKGFGAKTKDIVVNNAAKKKNVRIQEITEEAITSAIKKAMVADQKVVCLVLGHGELDSKESKREDGFSFGKDLIESEGLLTKEINLTGNVPSECAAVAMLGPQKGLPEADVNALTSYYRQGGNLFLMLDPIPTLKKDGLENFGIESWLASKGIELTQSVVAVMARDIFGRTGIMYEAISANFGVSEITAQLSKDTQVGFPVARALKLRTAEDAKKKPGAVPRMLVETGPEFWAETDMTAVFLRRPVKRDPAEQQGGLVIGALLEEDVATDMKDRRSPKSRLVVFGNSAFVNNKGLQVGYSRDLLLNALRYSTGEEKGLSIRARKLKTSNLNLTEDQQTLISFASVGILPQLIIILGSLVWTYRRRR